MDVLTDLQASIDAFVHNYGVKPEVIYMDSEYWVVCRELLNFIPMFLGIPIEVYPDVSIFADPTLLPL